MARTGRSREATTRRVRREALREIAIKAVAAGTDREDIVRACYAVLADLEEETGDAYEDPSGERVLELMDALTGFCGSHYRI
ncbi:hypothetical protein [Amycolatopsis sp. NPDC051372]|uniref:hypothetical protein n=1 Tax=unclassified Amycolatopsis TaxID=2618356 RepID=UPI00343DF7F0